MGSYTVAVKSSERPSNDYKRYEVDKDVYYYLRTLEMAVGSLTARVSLRERYPKRFGNDEILQG